MQQLAHLLVVLALIGAYVALTLTGHDANAVLALLAGYLGGAAVSKLPTSPAP